MSGTLSAAISDRRGTKIISFVSVAVLLACVVVIVRVLPLDQAIQRLREWVSGQGLLGVVVFALAYIGAGLAFVPGSALTIAAGAVFGVVAGTAVVSVASTATAALAFLIARHLARDKVESWARRSPRFSAVDRAIGEQGWKIVALMRLSPALPFSLGNYLYGLTSVRFVPYVLASWLCMLPGTLLYVLIGDAGATGLKAASGGTGTVETGRTAMLVVGLIATLAVTIFITRIARKALSDQGGFRSEEESESQIAVKGPPKSIGRAQRLVLPVGAVLAVFATLATCSARDALASLFGPPKVQMSETHARDVGDEVFDHSRFDTLLRKHVDAAGLVDYEALAEAPQELDAYIRSLAEAPFTRLGRNEKLALLINAYNAFTLRLILDHMPVESIRDIPDKDRWKARRWTLAGELLSLNDIEHERIRPHFVEPRIHFALVCAAIGCPPLRSEAYTGARLEEQLQAQSAYVHGHERWFQFDSEKRILLLTALYDWYGGDFRQVAGSIEAYAARYSQALKSALDAGRSVKVEFLDYDWSLNHQEKQQ